MIRRPPPLYVPGKRAYVRGVRPRVACILCSVAADDPRVDRLVVHRGRTCFVTLNLYPYNPGHLMVVPYRHVLDPRGLTGPEVAEMRSLQNRILDVLDARYQPHGYNVGYNIGQGSGASIEHLHLHIVPRFRNEIGFLDVIAGTRVHVDDPAKAVRHLRAALRRPPPRRRARRG